MNKKEMFKKVVQVLKNQRARKIAIFGSYVRRMAEKFQIKLAQRMRKFIKIDCKY